MKNLQCRKEEPKIAKVHGKNCYLTFGGTLVSTDSNSITLDVVGEVAEATTFADGWKEYFQGILGWTINGDGYWNSEGSASDLEFWDDWTQGEVAVDFRPGGSVIGLYKYSGNGIITAYSINPTLGGIITMSFSIQGTGELTRAIIA